MKTSSKEIALTTIFKSSSYITNKHHKKIKRNPQHLECSDFYIIQRTGEKPDYSLKSLGTTENTAEGSS